VGAQRGLDMGAAVAIADDGQMRHEVRVTGAELAEDRSDALHTIVRRDRADVDQPPVTERSVPHRGRMLEPLRVAP